MALKLFVMTIVENAINLILTDFFSLYLVMGNSIKYLKRASGTFVTLIS